MTMTNKLKRGNNVYFKMVGENEFEVTNMNHEVVYNSNEDYFIYFKNVTFKPNGEISGKYLGMASNMMIDEYCQNALYDDLNGFSVSGKKLRTANMVAVKNKSGAIVIVSSR